MEMINVFDECDQLLSYFTFTFCKILIRTLKKKQVCRSIHTERDESFAPNVPILSRCDMRKK